MEQPEIVTRFCPKCGAKAKAAKEKFETLQVCPGCKAAVLFWNLTEQEVAAVADAKKHRAILPSMPAMVLAGVATFLAVVAFLLFFVGSFALPVVLSVLLFVAGCYAIAIFLGQQYKISQLSAAIKELDAVLEESRTKQADAAIKFVGLKDNFRQLVDEANNRAMEAETSFLQQTASNSEEHSRRQAELEASYSQRVSTIDQEHSRRQAELERGYVERNKVAFVATQSIAKRYFEEVTRNLVAKISPDNFSQSRDKFLKAVEHCRRVGYDVSDSEIAGFLAELKTEFETAVRKQAAREEQAKIKERIREEQKAEAEFERERKRLEQEQKLVERLLQEARAKATAETFAQIEELERRLADAQDRQRSLSMAQQTKAGNVYVISNIGSFGEDVFKIGMTRRLDPMDRVRELGDASVPFPFDVHMMISSENAPALENSLHRAFNARRLNKVNFRKEFFRVSIEEIRGIVEQSQGVVEYVATPEALQYRESISMDAEEFATISEVMKDVSDDDDDE
jgi:outer membrane murein-binding lipoprotein Lpp